jgi:hypothetical protein
MDMIRHHDEIAHTVTLAIEMQERVGHNLCQFWLPEHSTAVTCIEERLTAAIERLLKLGPDVFCERRDDVRPVCTGLVTTLA